MVVHFSLEPLLPFSLILVQSVTVVMALFNKASNATMVWPITMSSPTPADLTVVSLAVVMAWLMLVKIATTLHHLVSTANLCENNLPLPNPNLLAGHSLHKDFGITVEQILAMEIFSLQFAFLPTSAHELEL
jgi:hypothetical protein